MASVANGKEKDEKMPSYFNQKLFFVIRTQINSFSISPKYLEKQVSSSISEINQQDDFRSLLSNLLSARDREWKYAVLHQQLREPPHSSQRRLIQQKTKKRDLFCLLHNTQSQLFSSREKIMDAEFCINSQIWLCSSSHCYH